MHSQTAFLLLSLWQVHSAQAAALREFYSSQRQQHSTTSSLTSSFSSFSSPLLPTPSYSQRLFSSLSSSQSHSSSSDTSTPSHDRSMYGAEDDLVPDHDQIPIARRQLEEGVQPTATAPAWITSPSWALYSFSGDLFPPPTETAAPISETVLPSSPSMVPIYSQILNAIASNQVQASRMSQITAGPSTLESVVSANSQIVPSSSLETSSISTATTSPSTTSSPSTTLTTTTTTSTLSSITSAATSLPAAPLAQQDSSNHTTAIAVGVSVPAASLAILLAAAFWLLRRRRKAALRSAHSSRDRFDSTDTHASHVGLLATIGHKLRGNSRRVSTSTTPDLLTDKSPAYDPAPSREPTTPRRAASPPRHGHRHSPSGSSLTDPATDRGNDVQDMDFHCNGHSRNSSWDSVESLETRRMMASLPMAAPSETITAGPSNALAGVGGAVTATGGIIPQVSRKQTQRSAVSAGSWLSTSDAEARRASNAPSLPEIHVDPSLLQTAVPPPALRRVPEALSKNERREDDWYSRGSEGMSFDSYHPEVEARDFALGIGGQERDRSLSRARSSLSLSSGPWSDSDEEESAEAPLARERWRRR